MSGADARMYPIGRPGTMLSSGDSTGSKTVASEWTGGTASPCPLYVFCSFLALVLRQELQSRLEERGHDLEWADVIGDLDRLQMVEVEQDGKRFLLRSEVQGSCGKVFQTAGVAIPPTVQQAPPTSPGQDAAHSATPSG